MTDATLSFFQNLAQDMREARGEDRQPDWQWIGQYMSQRMFGITEQRAKEYAERHGGVASKMA